MVRYRFNTVDMLIFDMTGAVSYCAPILATENVSKMCLTGNTPALMRIECAQERLCLPVGNGI